MFVFSVSLEKTNSCTDNPATGRCVSLTGNIGRKLIQGNVKILIPILENKLIRMKKINCGPDRIYP